MDSYRLLEVIAQVALAPIGAMIVLFAWQIKGDVKLLTSQVRALLKDRDEMQRDIKNIHGRVSHLEGRGERKAEDDA